MRLAPLLSAACLALATLDAAGGDLVRAARDGRVAAATVILFESGISLRAPMTEAELRRRGCTFTVAFKPAKLAALAEILERELRAEPGHDGVADQLRNIVYLRLLDGTAYRYALTDEVGGAGGAETVHAWADTYAGDGRALVAGPELLRALRAWAGSGTGRMNFRPACLEERFGGRDGPGPDATGAR